MKLRAFFNIFKGLSMKQRTRFFLEDERPTLSSENCNIKINFNLFPSKKEQLKQRFNHFLFSLIANFLLKYKYNHFFRVAKCIDNCLDIQKPVCGSDGRTYSNQCELDLASCRSNGKIKKVSDGECSKWLQNYYQPTNRSIEFQQTRFCIG